jgi:iturin family lipopeptide synthetase A
MDLPLTVQQRFFWDRPGGDDGLYTLIPFPFLLIGRVDLDRLQSSIQRLIDRHDALRTRIVLAPGAPPRQKFPATTRYPVEVVDLSAPGGTQSVIDAQLQAEIQTRFDRRVAFDTDSLFAATLFKLTTARHALVLWVNHLLADGHTPSLLLQDLWALYGGALNDAAEGEPMQYSRYCAWQQEHADAWVKEQKPYWAARLSGAMPVQWPNMPAGPREPHGMSEGASREVDSVTTAKLRTQALHSRKPLSLYALTAYAATVREWSNQSDFVLTIMLTGRLAREHLRIVGYLAQPLYMRVQTTPDAGFGCLLNTIGKEYFNALFHRDFGQTVLENPDLGAGTLFQWFPADWRLTPDASLHLGFRVEPLAFKHRGFFHEKFKLGVSVHETADQLYIRAGFRPDCLGRATVERLLEDIRGQLERQAYQQDPST